MTVISVNNGNHNEDIKMNLIEKWAQMINEDYTQENPEDFKDEKNTIKADEFEELQKEIAEINKKFEKKSETSDTQNANESKEDTETDTETDTEKDSVNEEKKEDDTKVTEQKNDEKQSV